MPRRDIPVEEMKKRVARLTELTPSQRPFVDTMLPNHERELFGIIGRGVTEDAEMRPAIEDVGGGFNVSYVRNLPGKRVALHDHDTVEVFIPLKGRYTIMWGDNEEHEITLDPFDVISVPPGVMRCFRNDSDEEGLLLVIFGGQDSGRVHWAPNVIAEAEKAGWTLSPEGDLVRAG